jgi:1-acyl-sn-glycerol-3-phosphate acyltransferase
MTWIAVLRSQLNRILVLVALVISLPTIAFAERLRTGKGRVVAVRTVRLVAGLCGVAFDVGIARSINPESAYIFVANHSSPMDIPAVLVACPGVRFVAAAELFRIPLLAAAMTALDTIPLERRNPEAARAELAVFAATDGAGNSRIAIFPEGGIAPLGERLAFKSGAFALAIETGVPVVPVAIRGTDQVLTPRGRLAVRSGTVKVRVLDPVSSEGLRVDDRAALRDSVREALISAIEE